MSDSNLEKGLAVMEDKLDMITLVLNDILKELGEVKNVLNRIADLSESLQENQSE